MQESVRETAVAVADTPVRVERFTGFYTLFRKEWMRFWKVKVQTILAPVLTALLYLLVFDVL